MKRYKNKDTNQIGVVVHQDVTTTFKFDDNSELTLSPARVRDEWEELVEVTYEELCGLMKEWNQKHADNVKRMSAIICYKQENFNQPFTEKERSYRVWNTSGIFRKKPYDELIGDCLDGTDDGCNLDLVDWEIEYCIIE